MLSQNKTDQKMQAIKHIIKNNLLNQLYNADKTPISFDMLSIYTIEQNGKMSII